MRLRQAVAGLGNAEIAGLRIGAQAIGFEILLAMMTDGDPLFRTRARFGGRQRAGLGLAILGLDGFSRWGFGGGLVGDALARRRFLLRRGAGRGPRCWLLPGHRRSPFPFDAERLAHIATRGVAKRQRAHHPTERRTVDQCSRNTPSTARSSAGLISLE